MPTMGRRTSVLSAIILPLLVGPAAAVAQEAETETAEEFWIDYNPRWTSESGRELFGDIGFRTLVDSDEWLRIVVRPGIRGPVGPFRLSGGIGTFYRINKGGADQLEIRPFQGISATWPQRPRLRLQHYLRFEEQLIWETADWTNDASLRGRYRLQTDYSLSGFHQGSDWRIIFHAEGFYTLLGKEGNAEEQVRLGVGVGRNVGSKLRLRADFTWEKLGFELRGSSDRFYLRLRVFQGLLRRLLIHDG